MFSALAQAELINAAVLVATLHADLGKNRKLGALRVVRPAVLTATIVPLFIDPVATRGTGLAVELAGLAAGLLGGLAALALTRVHRSPVTGKPVTSAGLPYALLWFAIIGARAVFSYGSAHWFSGSLAHWCAGHQVTAAAITDGLIFMAVVMVLTRTVGMAARAAVLPGDGREPHGPAMEPAGAGEL